MRPRFCAWCGAPLRSRTLDGRQRKVCARCDRVAWENPVPAAAAVVRRAEQVLLCRRNIEPYRGSWTLPAGYQELDETIEATAVREVREETGLIVRLTDLLDVFTTPDDPRKPSTLVVYGAQEVDGELRPGSDCGEVAFHALDDLPAEVGFQNHRTVLQRLRKGTLRAW